MGLLVLPFTLPGIDPDNSEETDREDLSRVRTRPLAPAIVLGLLVVLCISGMLIEDAGFSWATLFMRDYANTGAALAGSGYVVLLSTHALGRFIADPLVGRFGPRAVVAGGGALILAGMGADCLSEQPQPCCSVLRRRELGPRPRYLWPTMPLTISAEWIPRLASRLSLGWGAWLFLSHRLLSVFWFSTRLCWQQCWSFPPRALH